MLQKTLDTLLLVTLNADVEDTGNATCCDTGDSNADLRNPKTEDSKTGDLEGSVRRDSKDSWS